MTQCSDNIPDNRSTSARRDTRRAA